ncbi:cyclic lactone autoinducer peptide [Clostridium sp. DJ247]|nr:cyclic lactone autoinducer peptide [Clostridium sp. DJ247]MBC2579787.1 cyclic lactone autoinducer peptide [Clostridium sp. DJ247]
MRNKAVKTILMLGASIFTFFAVATSASACGYSFYQPKEPKCLRDK